MGCKSKSTDISRCSEAVKKSYTYANRGADESIYFDSALTVIDHYLHCDSARRALADIKIRILLSQQRYSGALKFIDSLSNNDFTYPYKSIVTAGQVRYLASKTSDSVHAATELASTVDYLSGYIKSSELSDPEFKEAFIDLFSLKGKILDSTAINREVDSLKNLHPEKSQFFEFFRMTK
jgi:hypothetical protein